MHVDIQRLTDEFIREAETLLDAYYEATVAKDGLPPYDFDWRSYRSLESIGSLLVASMRGEGNELQGFIIYFIVNHPHHKSLLIAECDTLSVDHRLRGKGIGRTLYYYCEPILKSFGVRRITHRYRTVYQTEPLFPSLGFKLDEHVYLKEI